MPNYTCTRIYSVYNSRWKFPLFSLDSQKLVEKTFILKTIRVCLCQFSLTIFWMNWFRQFTLVLFAPELITESEKGDFICNWKKDPNKRRVWFPNWIGVSFLIWSHGIWLKCHVSPPATCQMFSLHFDILNRFYAQTILVHYLHVLVRVKTVIVLTVNIL